ncbi:hypothetical protein BGZ49_007447 [Haplosporangium sp. Z 27]|nr:hypothetical protein BGZ49_007447 [Haplosporangium sp. Z 27]
MLFGLLGHIKYHYKMNSTSSVNNEGKKSNSVPREHIDWLANRRENGDTFTAFVEFFGFKERKLAELAYNNLTQCSLITKERREQLANSFATWNTKHGQRYWTKAHLRNSTQRATNNTAQLVIRNAKEMVQKQFNEDMLEIQGQGESSPQEIFSAGLQVENPTRVPTMTATSVSTSQVENEESHTLAVQTEDRVQSIASVGSITETEQEKSELMSWVTPPYRPPVQSDTESEPDLAINLKLGKRQLDQHSWPWDSSKKRHTSSTMEMPLPTSTLATDPASSPLSQFTVSEAHFSDSGIFALLQQKTTWETTFDIGGYFSRIRGSLKSSFDISKDNIMDMTSASSFVMSISDEIYTEAMEDMPTLDFGLEEIKELKIIMEPECSLRSLETGFTSYLSILLSVDIYTELLSHIVPELEEKQGMFDVICPFVRGALRVFGVPSNISEIAIMATGERRNFDQNYEDRLQSCKRADIVAADKDGIQIFLAECAMLHEIDVRKFTEDRWKVARCMKDIWDFGIRRTTQIQSPHENFSTFGLHSFGRELHFLQLDFCSSYRLWEIETCHVPLELAGFWKKMMTCCETSLAFAKAVMIEVERRKRQEKLSQKQRLSLIRAANNIPRTTVSPPKPKIKR